MEEEMYEEEDPDYERRKLQQHLWPGWDGLNTDQSNTTGWPATPQSSNEATPFFAFQPSEPMVNATSPIQPQFNDVNSAMDSNQGTPLMTPYMSTPLSPSLVSPLQQMQYEAMFMDQYVKSPVNSSTLSQPRLENQLTPKLDASNFGKDFITDGKSNMNLQNQLSAEFNIQDFYTDPNQFLEESPNFEETTGECQRRDTHEIY
jgi:hypothetical protein